MDALRQAWLVSRGKEGKGEGVKEETMEGNVNGRCSNEEF